MILILNSVVSIVLSIMWEDVNGKELAQREEWSKIIEEYKLIC